MTYIVRQAVAYSDIALVPPPPANPSTWGQQHRIDYQYRFPRRAATLLCSAPIFSAVSPYIGQDGLYCDKAMLAVLARSPFFPLAQEQALCHDFTDADIISLIANSVCLRRLDIRSSPQVAGHFITSTDGGILHPRPDSLIQSTLVYLDVVDCSAFDHTLSVAVIAAPELTPDLRCSTMKVMIERMDRAPLYGKFIYEKTRVVDVCFSLLDDRRWSSVGNLDGYSLAVCLLHQTLDSIDATEITVDTAGRCLKRLEWLFDVDHAGTRTNASCLLSTLTSEEVRPEVISTVIDDSDILLVALSAMRAVVGSRERLLSSESLLVNNVGQSFNTVIQHMSDRLADVTTRYINITDRRVTGSEHQNKNIGLITVLRDFFNTVHNPDDEQFRALLSKGSSTFSVDWVDTAGTLWMNVDDLVRLRCLQPDLMPLLELGVRVALQRIEPQGPSDDGEDEDDDSGVDFIFMSSSSACASFICSTPISDPLLPEGKEGCQEELNRIGLTWLQARLERIRSFNRVFQLAGADRIWSRLLTWAAHHADYDEDAYEHDAGVEVHNGLLAAMRMCSALAFILVQLEQQQQGGLRDDEDGQQQLGGRSASSAAATAAGTSASKTTTAKRRARGDEEQEIATTATEEQQLAEALDEARGHLKRLATSTKAIESVALIAAGHQFDNGAMMDMAGDVVARINDAGIAEIVFHDAAGESDEEGEGDNDDDDNDS